MEFRPSFISMIVALELFPTFVYAQGTPTASDLDQAAWEAVNKKIIDRIQGIDKGLTERYSIHLATTPMYAVWDEGEDGKWEFLEIADEIPQWGPTFLKKSRFSDEYKMFVESVYVKPREGVDSKLLKQKQSAYEEISKRTNAEQRALLAEWERYKAKRSQHGQKPIPYGVWFKEYSAKAPGVKSLRDKRDKAYQEYSALVNPQDKTIGDFRRRFTDFDFSADDDLVKGEQRYPYNYAEQSLKRIKEDGDTQFEAKTPVFEWISNRDTERRREERESWGAGASYGRFFGVFGVNGSASGDRYTLDLTNNTVNISYAAYGFGFVSIEPRGWYSSALVSHYLQGKGDFLPNSPVSNSTLWGQNGSLNLRPVGVVVAYRPQISAKMSANMLKIARETLAGGGSVSWGPFSFGGRWTKSTEAIDKDKQEGTLTISSISPYPYVVAVITQRLIAQEK